MIKEGDLVYLHTLFNVDGYRGVEKGIYKVDGVRYRGVNICIPSLGAFHTTYYIEDVQFYEIIPNKINKLLYEGVKW